MECPEWEENRPKNRIWYINIIHIASFNMQNFKYLTSKSEDSRTNLDTEEPYMF